MFKQSFRALLTAGMLFIGMHSQAEQAPATLQINALYQELQALHWVDQRGGWPSVDADRTLEPGSVDAAIAQVRKRLILAGDLPSNQAMPDSDVEAQTYDAQLQAAVIRFQSRHGLEPDGIIGPGTLRAMNVSVQSRIQQLERSIQRWDALAATLDQEGSYLLVNIPEFTLRLYDQQQLALDMRVVVGTTRRQTPELQESLEYLVVNPFWYVPRRISAYELLPKVQADPSYLENKQYEVWKDGRKVEASQVAWQDVTPDSFEYSLRQRPGAGNSLGQVKFMLPNSSNIYLHDTPSRSHFSKPRRAYSHGCIRLEDPFRLARAVLAMQSNMSDEDIERQLAKNYNARIDLDEHLPVHIVYITNWAHDGVVHYYDDIYGHHARTQPAEEPAPVQRYQAANDDPQPKTRLTWSVVAATGN